MKTIKLFSVSALALTAAFTVSSCQEYEPFDMEAVTKAEYSKNFFKEYGQFPADMNWDLSSRPRTAKIDESVFDFGLETRSVPGTTTGEASAIATYRTGSERSDYYYVEMPTLEWLRSNLVEGRNNTSKGKPFRLSLQSGHSFAIIPIYQGNAQMVWDLHLVNNGVDYKIWTKNQGLEIRTPDKVTFLNNAHELNPDDPQGREFINMKYEDGKDVNNNTIYKYIYSRNGYLNGVQHTEYEITSETTQTADYYKGEVLINSPISTYVAKQDKEASADPAKKYIVDVFSQLGPTVGSYTKAHTMDVSDSVRAKPIIINNISGEFYLYLDITTGDPKNYAPVGTAQRSDQGMMLALSCPLPSKINEQENKTLLGATQDFSKVMIIGCEDAHLPGSDWDINDVVFLVVGLPDLPNIIEYSGKRYMIEDLGNTYDFDFNDIVVDVSEVNEKTASSTAADGSVIWTESTTPGSVHRQEATIRYLCGTLPFQVGFSGENSFEFTRMQGKIDYVPPISADTRHVETESSKFFWNKNTNNIYVKVLQEKDGDWTDHGNIFTVAFPDKKRNDDKSNLEIAPMILATDQSVVWMNESKHIPVDWWQLGQFENDALNIQWKENLLANNNFKLTISGEKVKGSCISNIDATPSVTEGTNVNNEDFNSSTQKATVRFYESSFWSHVHMYIDYQEPSGFEFTPGKYDVRIKYQSNVDISFSMKFSNVTEIHNNKMPKGERYFQSVFDLSGINGTLTNLFLDIYLQQTVGGGELTISDIFIQPHEGK